MCHNIINQNMCLRIVLSPEQWLCLLQLLHYGNLPSHQEFSGEGGEVIASTILISKVAWFNTETHQIWLSAFTAHMQLRTLYLLTLCARN